MKAYQISRLCFAARDFYDFDYKKQQHRQLKIGNKADMDWLIAFYEHNVVLA